MFLKLQDLRKEDLWTCTTCASGISVINKKADEQSAQIGKIDKRVQVVEGKQERAEEREKTNDMKFIKMEVEIIVLRGRCRKMKENKAGWEKARGNMTNTTK